MLLSKNKQSKEYLQEQFAQRQVYRIYHAMVEGQPLEKSGTVEHYLMEDKHLNIRLVNSKHKEAKLAITHWEVVQQNDEASLIRVMIETGRRHQIRMAMKELGCPIIGDKLHEAESNPFGRICLHATSLEFLHPATDEPVRFESQPPFAKI
jgi:23S rRNA-/tRNA-specific pseudouridylate synthase